MRDKPVHLKHRKATFGAGRSRYLE